MIAQLLLALSLLIGLHELGHLLAAKLFGMRVEKYAIGFPPKIFGFIKGETEYMLGAIPLGGFVKISGMIDESLDTENLKSEPEPYEFRAKPAWQRLIVMLGGIIVNVITGVIIFIFLLYFQGEKYLPIDEANQYGINVSEIGQELGLQRGDKVIKINGELVTKFEDLRNPKKLLSENSSYTILRDGQEIEIPIPPDFLDKLADKKNMPFIEPLYPFDIAKVMADSPAQKAGIQQGDKIIKIDNTQIRYWQDLSDFVANHVGQTVQIQVFRAEKIENLTATISQDGLLGVQPNLLMNYSHEKYSLIQSIPKGTKDAFSVIGLQVMAFSKMFSGDLDPRKSLSGPIGIAKLFGTEWNWGRFWYLAGMLSMVLAFMNLLPIPALDGGHVMFLSYEIISGRAPSDKFLEIAQKIGMFFLLALMVLIIGKEILEEVMALFNA